MQKKVKELNVIKNEEIRPEPKKIYEDKTLHHVYICINFQFIKIYEEKLGGSY